MGILTIVILYTIHVSIQGVTEIANRYNNSHNEQTDYDGFDITFFFF